MGRKGHIYLIRNLINGHGYVGKTVSTVAKRFGQHKADANRGVDYLLYRAMRKYGVYNFSVTLVASCDVTLLDDLERYFIKSYGTFSGRGYNLTEGGGGQVGRLVSSETRLKMSAAKQGHIPWNKGKRGHKASAETRAKQSAAMRGKKKPPRSDEHKAKMGAAGVGRPVSEITRAKLSASTKRYWEAKKGVAA